ncbi:porin [Cupriavidus necator]|uniref:Porin n=1 Tax=Cupriavidus necator TaxID=106590 RepID=A0A1U9UQ46_CUPNE|nr:porin [Cupriavidus necator]AQV94275.1 porin [Cupriavidus necator]
MKRQMFAGLVVGTIAACAHGEGVTLYGILDTGIEFTNHWPTNPTNPGATGNRWSMADGARSGGSRWGLTGKEDLGGGLKTEFVLESGFLTPNGALSQNLFGRGAWIGLTLPQGGTFRLGRQYTSLLDALYPSSPTDLAGTYEPIVAETGANLWESNVVKYKNAFGPVTVIGHYSFSNAAGQFSNGSGYGAAVLYDNGTATVSAAYDNFHSPTGVDSSYARFEKAAIAVTYSTARLKLMGGYRFGQNDPVAGHVARDDFLWAGARYQFAVDKFLTVAYYYDHIHSATGVNGEVTKPASPHQVVAIADYLLSKRTALYLVVGYSRNSALNFDSFNGTAAAYKTASPGSSQTGGQIGIRHLF